MSFIFASVINNNNAFETKDKMLISKYNKHINIWQFLDTEFYMKKEL